MMPGSLDPTEDRSAMPRHRLLAPFPRLVLAAALLAAGCGKSVEERLVEARELQGAQQFERSLDPLRSVLEEEPGHPEASFRLGLALAKTGQLSGSIFPLRQAAETDEFAVQAGLVLAQVYLNTGNVDQAHEAATRVLEREPGQVEALMLRVQTAHRRGEYEQALADAERIVEREPGPRALGMRIAALEALGRYDEERDALTELETLERERGDLGEAARACAVRAASFEKSDGGKLERAVAALEPCIEQYPTQLIVLEAAARWLPRERALDLWRNATEEAPESLELRLGHARLLAVAGNTEEAAAVARTAADDFRTAEAWLALADYELALGRPDEADAALEKAAAAAAPQQADMIALRRADLRVANGDYAGAEQLAAQVRDTALADVVRGHVLLEKGEFEQALQLLEKALERHPNHPGARTLAGRAAQLLGQEERALAHYREVVRVDPTASNAALFAAQLASSLGRHKEAAEYAARYLGEAKAPPDAQAFSLGIRSAHRAGFTDVEANLLHVMSLRPDLAAAYAVEKAWIAQQSGGPAAAARAIEASGIDLTDPANETALRALMDAELASGRGEQALARVDAALAREPERASLHDARGRVLLQLGRGQEARAEFQRAVEADPSYGPARSGLGALAFQEGKLEEALRLFDEAAQAAQPDPEASYRAAQAAAALGRKQEAKDRYRAVLADHPDHAGANNDLAWLLAEEKEDLDTALALAERAVGLEPVPNAWDTLAYVQMQRGDADAARETLESALAKHAGNPTLLYRLGLVRKASGDREGAMNAFRQALEAGAFPESEATRAELASLERSGP